MRQLTHLLFKEIAIWYTPPLLFLALYVGYFHNPISAITDHLYSISLIALSIILLSVLFYQVIRKQIVAFILSCLLYATSLYALVIYYCLVIIGLTSWGRVITEELIVSYAQQMQQLCEAVGISYVLAITLLLTGYVITIAGCFFVLKKADSQRKINNPHISPAIINALLLTFLLATGYRLQSNFENTDLSTKEPFHLTLFSGKPQETSQIHKVQTNGLLDKQEDIAKARYQIASGALRKNVILIVVDALRPDHMGVYGYHRETTPYLTSLASQGQLTKINHVHASCGESACGLTSIATSKYSHQLPNSPFTLQQLLQRYGYSIHMILGGDHTHFYNLKDIYGKVDSYYDGSMAKQFYMNDDSLIIEKAKILPEWDGTPVMFQFHMMSAHPLGKRLTNFEIFKPHKSYTGKNGNPREEYTNHYDNGVVQTDAMIRELLDTLKNKNYLKEALIIITADHGESLGEHQLFSHANSVREELLHLPLLLLDINKQFNFNIDENHLFSQVDIAPTVLYDLNMPIPITWHGQPMQLANNHTKHFDFTFFQMYPNIGLYDHRNPSKLWKYWTNINTNEEFAFNLSIDPKEQKNLIMSTPLNLKYEWRKIAYSTQLH